MVRCPWQVRGRSRHRFNSTTRATRRSPRFPTPAHWRFLPRQTSGRRWERVRSVVRCTREPRPTQATSPRTARGFLHRLRPTPSSLRRVRSRQDSPRMATMGRLASRSWTTDRLGAPASDFSEPSRTVRLRLRSWRVRIGLRVQMPRLPRATSPRRSTT